ncbi:hypothetical protein Dsin_019155 [Dipteronia sinensis]|uniref:Transmembrane protein n=1 Tax=Dipteronia sinensis TaxID=43782 RepID=A0AAE0E3S6_9ROSI|nr:hypothetical protein Dsin_019155 [Dipteronia sinensis]
MSSGFGRWVLLDGFRGYVGLTNEFWLDRWLVDRHSKVGFWTDNWLGLSLIDLIEDHSSLQTPLECVVGDIYSDTGGGYLTSPIPPGWLKVNTNGVALGSPGLAGCAWVFCTCRFFVNVALIFLLVSVLLLRLSRRLSSMQLIMLGPLVGISCGWRVIVLIWWPSFLLGLVRFFGADVRLEIGVLVYSLKWILLSLIFIEREIAL